MAYAGDLKSLALRGVRVRLPPRAPTYFAEMESINTLCFHFEELMAALQTLQQERCVAFSRWKQFGPAQEN